MIFKIFRKDLKGLVCNILALVVALGLCIIPSLYAWFNIYSNWDPYANTSAIKIAIVSNDKGYKDGKGETSNMGEKIVEQLHSNDKLGWQFPSDDKTAMEELMAGNYYALIVIGEDFSKSLYDFLANGLVRPTVTYYDNAKKNAVASKITDTGKSTLETTINQEFVGVCVTTIIENLNKLSKDDPEVFSKVFSDLDAVTSNINQYNTMIDTLIESNKSLSEGLLKLEGLIPQTQSALEKTSNVASVADSTIDSLTADIEAKLDAVGESIGTLSDEAKGKLEEIREKLSSEVEGVDISGIKDDVSSTIEFIKAIDTQNDQLELIVDQFKSYIPNEIYEVIKGNISAQKIITKTAIEAFSKLPNGDVISKISDRIDLKVGIVTPQLDSLSGILEELNNAANTYVSQSVQLFKSSLKASVDSVGSSVTNVKDSLSGMSSLLLGLSDISLSANTTLSNIKLVLGQMEDKIKIVMKAVEGLDNGEIYDLVNDILNADSESYGTFFSSPVKVEEHPVYLTANYGTYVSPFYTTLALWVGGIVLVALMKVAVDYKDDEFMDVTENQKYFGRLTLFLAMGQLQTLIVVLGDLYLLKVQCEHPFLFYLSCAFTSLVFTTFIYTLVLTFGDIGKAVAVVMVVLQIAGSGGTYPIELLPDFFQNIYLYFPFPYAINAMREAMLGMYEMDYLVYLIKLSSYLVVSLVIGLFIRKPLVPIKDFFQRRMHETHFM